MYLLTYLSFSLSSLRSYKLKVLIYKAILSGRVPCFYLQQRIESDGRFRGRVTFFLLTWTILEALSASTHMLAIPAFLTAELTAFTAVCMLFNSCVRSPVAVGTLRCSANTNLVNVMQSESIMSFDVIARGRNRATVKPVRGSRARLGSTETEIGAAEAPRYIRQGP